MNGRVALVTGASRGIGAAIALRLARDGHHVWLNYRVGRDRAQSVLTAIETSGGRGSLISFDVRNRQETREALDEVLRDGPVSVLVNNAGVVRDAAFPAMKDEQWDDVLQTSLDGFFHVTRPLVMPMVTNRFGRIITISSVSGLLGNRGQVNYSAAKAGLIGATRSLACEVARKGVTVNAVAPGIIATDDDAADDTASRLLEHVPMRRAGTADEVAAAVAFLASDEASYVTGQVLGVNGGLV